MTSERQRFCKACNDMWILLFTQNHIPKETNRLRSKPISRLARILSCLNVEQRVCKIMVTLDVDLWLMICSREEDALKTVYVSMLVGAKQVCTIKGLKGLNSVAHWK